jgi:hypothetical protein
MRSTLKRARQRKRRRQKKRSQLEVEKMEPAKNENPSVTTEEEEILGKVLEWTNPVRQGSWQRQVRVKDWEIDPAGPSNAAYSFLGTTRLERGREKRVRGRRRCRTMALHVPSTLARRIPRRRGANTGLRKGRKPKWKGTSL